MIMAKLSTQTYDCPTFRKLARLLGAAFMCLLATHKSLAECKYYFSPIDKQFDQIAIEINRADYDNERQGINPSWLDKLASIAKKSNNRQLKARAIYWRVRSTQMDAQPSLCLPMLKEALKNTDAVQYPYDAARIHYQLAGNYNRLRQYLNCYNEVKQAIPVFDKANDYFFLGNSYLLLVQLFIDIGNNEEALSYLKKYKGKEPILAARAHACEGDAYVALGDYAAAVRSYKAAAALADNVFAAGYLLKEGSAHEALGQKAEALACYKTIESDYPQSLEAYEIAKSIARVTE